MNRYEAIARALHPEVYEAREHPAYALSWPALVDDVHELYWAVAEHLARELDDAGMGDAAHLIRAHTTDDTTHPTGEPTAPHATVLPFTPRHAAKDPQ